MLLKTLFVFFDFDEPLIFFFLDYLAVMVLFVCLGHYGSKLLKKHKKQFQATAHFKSGGLLVSSRDI